MSVVWLALLATGLRQTVPLLFAALGGMFSERGGIVNVALEGILLFGALAAAVTVERLENGLGWHSFLVPWLGVLAAVIVGAAVALLHGWICIRYRADQIVSGIAINMLAIGISALVLSSLYATTASSPPVEQRLPVWEGASPLLYLAFLLVPVSWYILFRTPFGLRLRAVGEAPHAAASAGADINRIRYTGVLISGVLGGLGGAFLSIGILNQFVAGMSAGRGFIALAAMIFGNWHPWRILAASLLFGFTDAAAIYLQSEGLVPGSLIQALPFVLTMLVLAGLVGRVRPPAASGKIEDS